MTVLYWAPSGTEPPTGGDGAGRPITLTPDGITRWETLGTINQENAPDDPPPL